MASRNDGDVQDKGRRLWNALKNKKIGRVERKSIIQELLKNGAPVNFREPDKQVRNFINDVSVVIICRGITPHYYLPKKKRECKEILSSAQTSLDRVQLNRSIALLERIIVLPLFIHGNGKL